MKLILMITIFDVGFYLFFCMININGFFCSFLTLYLFIIPRGTHVHFDNLKPWDICWFGTTMRFQTALVIRIMLIKESIFLLQFPYVIWTDS